MFLSFFLFLCFFFGTGIVCIVSCAQCSWLRLYGQKIRDSKNWALPSPWSWGDDFVWILQVQFTENIEQQNSEKPSRILLGSCVHSSIRNLDSRTGSWHFYVRLFSYPRCPWPQELWQSQNSQSWFFTFHYFWVGDYPNLHKLVWYSGMTGHIVTSKCSIASCIHWPCSSPAPSVRIASDSKHQPCRFLSLYCHDEKADRPHFLCLPHFASIYCCRSRTATGTTWNPEIHVSPSVKNTSILKIVDAQPFLPAFSSFLPLFFFSSPAQSISIACMIWLDS